MERITIIYDGSKYTYTWLKPMMWAKEEFLKAGYDVEFSSIADYLPVMYSYQQKHGVGRLKLELACRKQYDIAFLAFHHSTSWLGTCSSEDRVRILKQFRAHAKTVCWLDTADSTGTCLFDVMPYVDYYFKKQILKERGLYLTTQYGGRLFCDYYHQLLKTDDETIMSRVYSPCKQTDLQKLRLSWNVGMGDLFVSSKKQLILHPSAITPPFWQNPNKSRAFDIHYRGSGYSPIAGFQRRKCQNFICQLENKTHPDPTTKVPKQIYLNEIRNAKAILSPFGWGEICTRDFEAFAYGATLLKPSMEHCVTWPDVYRKNETYIPIEWDFCNIHDVFDKLGSPFYQNVAERGQEIYRKYFADSCAKENFVNHLLGQMQDTLAV